MSLSQRRHLFGVLAALITLSGLSILYGQGNPPNPFILQGGGSGTTGLTSCTGGTALADNLVMRADGTTGCQGSAWLIDDTGDLQTSTATTGKALAAQATSSSTVPAWSFIGDTNTGVGRAGADQLSLIAGGVEGLEVTSTAWLASADGVQTVGASSSRRPLVYAYGLSSGSTIAAGELRWSAGAGAGTVLQNTAINLGSNLLLGWSSNDPVSNAKDAHFGRAAAGVIFAGNGSGTENDGWITSEGTERTAADDATVDSVTPATTGLSVTLAAGRSYIFECHFYANTPTAADGFRVDFDGGAATMTAFRVYVQGNDATGAVTASNASMTSALATDITWTSTTGDAHYEANGTMTVNAGGTFIPRYAKEADAGAAVTLYRGSSCIFTDAP